MSSVLSRLADAFRAPAEPAVIAAPTPMPVRDALMNPMTGMGLSNDAAVHSRYFHRRLMQWEIEQAYSSSWLMRKLIDKPAKDQVRPRRQWKADKPTIALLEKEEKRLNLWGHHKTAEIERGLGGGAIVIWIKGDDPMQPLDPSRIKKGSITSLSVWKRWHFRLGEKIFDLGNEWHGQPEYFEIASLNLTTQTLGVSSSTLLRLHPSRVIVYPGEHVPSDNYSSWEDRYWGASKVEIALAAVVNADTSQHSFAGMIKDAINVIIGIPNLTTTYKARADIEAYQSARMSAVNSARSMWRAIVKDNGADGKTGAETVEYRQMVWNGIPQALMGFVGLVAAAGNMPVTELVGTSAQGLNATGEGDRTSWYDELGTRRDTEGKPCLEKMDTALIPSALGKVDDGVWWEYGPFSQPSDLDKANAAYFNAQARQIYIQSGALNQLALEKSLANTIIEEGVFVGFDDALDEIPDDEKYPQLAAPEVGANGNPVDPSALAASPNPHGAKGGDQSSAGGGTKAPARRAVGDALTFFADATPRPLYVQRKLLNAKDLIAWAKANGFTSTLAPDDMHVTVLSSKTAVDPMKMGEGWSGDDKGRVMVKPGGPRAIERLGPSAVVLLFASYDIEGRHRGMVEAGGSHDFDSYQPHVTISYDVPADVDLTAIKPYAGALEFGPELFEPMDLDWKSKVTEQ